MGIFKKKIKMKYIIKNKYKNAWNKRSTLSGWNKCIEFFLISLALLRLEIKEFHKDISLRKFGCFKWKAPLRNCDPKFENDMQYV